MHCPGPLGMNIGWEMKSRVSFHTGLKRLQKEGPLEGAVQEARGMEGRDPALKSTEQAHSPYAAMAHL